MIEDWALEVTESRAAFMGWLFEKENQDSGAGDQALAKGPEVGAPEKEEGTAGGEGEEGGEEEKGQVEEFEDGDLAVVGEEDEGDDHLDPEVESEWRDEDWFGLSFAPEEAKDRRPADMSRGLFDGSWVSSEGDLFDVEGDALGDELHIKKLDRKSRTVVADLGYGETFTGKYNKGSKGVTQIRWEDGDVWRKQTVRETNLTSLGLAWQMSSL